MNLYKYKYCKIRNTAWRFLLANNVDKYPIDIEKIIKQNGWLLCSASSPIANQLCQQLELQVDDAITIDGDDYICIIYNENMSEQRIRFSLAHEIGHIVLRHSMRKIKDEEKEANMFAARILMPMSLIKEKGLKTPEELAKACNVSLESATYRFTRYMMLVHRNKFYISPLEKKLKIRLNKGDL